MLNQYAHKKVIYYMESRKTGTIIPKEYRWLVDFLHERLLLSVLAALILSGLGIHPAVVIFVFAVQYGLMTWLLKERLLPTFKVMDNYKPSLPKSLIKPVVGLILLVLTVYLTYNQRLSLIETILWLALSFSFIHS